MRLVLQRVRRAAVTVGEEGVGAIGPGVVVFAGVEHGDGPAHARAAAKKLAELRIFEDAAGRMNFDAAAAGAAFLVVSQFTVAGEPLAKGRRPSFDGAAPPAVAAPLCELLVAELGARGFVVASGRFGAAMAVELVNDGPVTFVLDLRF